MSASISSSQVPLAAPRVAVIGAGPAGLMAAEVLAAGGAQVDVYDAMPSVGRKFLLAGKGGLNLTHSEAFDAFASRYTLNVETVSGRKNTVFAVKLKLDDTSGRLKPGMPADITFESK